MSDTLAPALGGHDAELRPGLRLREIPAPGQITLRVADVSAPVVGVLLGKLLGVSAPAPLTASFGEAGRAAVWMAPDELLLLLERGGVPGAIANLERALAGQHHLALDVSDARALLRLEGADARETLAKGVPVDLSDAAFPVGRARRTHLGGLAVGLWRRAPETWEIVGFRSYAHHLAAWLARSGQEGAEIGGLS